MTTAFTWPFCTSFVAKELLFLMGAMSGPVSDKGEVIGSLFQFVQILRKKNNPTCLLLPSYTLSHSQVHYQRPRVSPMPQVIPRSGARPWPLRKTTGPEFMYFHNESTHCGQVSPSWKSTLKQPFPNIRLRKSQFNLRLETDMRISLGK